MVETARLQIMPLDCESLELYIQAGGLFEKAYQLKNTGRAIAPQVRDRVLMTLLPAMKNAGPHLLCFYTFWIIIEKSSRSIVGELGFKGEPGPDGSVEIGYGTMPAFRGMGFMTEAVGGMLRWAESEPAILSVAASIAPGNAASIGVVCNNHFRYMEQKEGMTWWRFVAKK